MNEQGSFHNTMLSYSSSDEKICELKKEIRRINGKIKRLRLQRENFKIRLKEQMNLKKQENTDDPINIGTWIDQGT